MSVMDGLGGDRESLLARWTLLTARWWMILDGQCQAIRPGRPHGLVHQGAHRRRIGSSFNRGEIDLTPEFRGHHGYRNDAGVFDRVLRKKSEAETARDHRQNPVVPIAAINGFAIYATLVENNV